MKDHQDILAELVELSCWLGAPERDCTILGEGNTSVAIDDDTFFVKTSGSSLGSVNSTDFVAMRRSSVIGLLDGLSVAPDAQAAVLRQAKVDPVSAEVPSVETPLHAVCLGLPGVRFVGHTHPTAINAITCSSDYEEVLSRHVFPDQVLACGPRSLRVPCKTPGIELGQSLRLSLADYIAEWGEPPKTIYLRNHGFVALGETSNEVKALTQMAIKAARILAGTMAFGGPQEMPQENTDPHRPQR